MNPLSNPEGRGKDQAEHPVQAVNHVLKGVGNAAVKNNLTDVHAEAEPEQQPGQHTHGQKPKGKPTQHEVRIEESAGNRKGQRQIQSGTGHKPEPEMGLLLQMQAEQQLNHQNLDVKIVDIPHHKKLPPKIAAIFSMHSFRRRREIGRRMSSKSRESSWTEVIMAQLTRWLGEMRTKR